LLEETLAVTDCQKYLNGGFHTPYVPPDASEAACAYYNSDWNSYNDEYKGFLKQYFTAQIDAYEQGAGWFMWTMKTEDNCAPEWDFIFLLEKGIIAGDLCEREHFCQF
jgi:glucan 1,3-beta-glucosidase